MSDAEEIRELPPAREAPGLHAGFWRRVAAYVVDYLIIFLGLLLLEAIAAVAAAATGHSARHFLEMLSGVNNFLLDLVILVLVWPYFSLFESSRFQATPGKMALGLAVTDEYGQRIGFGRATGRYFAKILSALVLCIGYMMAGWTEHKQALHDGIAGTCVVQKRGLRALRVREGLASEAADVQMSRRSVWLIRGAVSVAVVTGIIAILSAIAIPIYLNYTGGAQIEEAINTTHKVRDILVSFRGQYGAWPSYQGIATFNGKMERNAPIGKYTRDVRIVNCAGRACAIVATFRSTVSEESIRGKTLELWTIDGGRSWHCGPGGKNPASPKALPASCRDAVFPEP